MAFTFAMLLHSVVLLLLLVLLLLILLLAMLIHVVCSTDNVMLVETYQFNDSANDVFQREPYCVKFRLYEIGEPLPTSVLIFCFISCTPPERKEWCCNDRSYPHRNTLWCRFIEKRVRISGNLCDSQGVIYAKHVHFWHDVLLWYIMIFQFLLLCLIL